MPRALAQVLHVDVRAAFRTVAQAELAEAAVQALDPGATRLFFMLRSHTCMHQPSPAL
jgi:hypothetical protein